ncbi:MAG: hypothetical protein J7513_18535 [Solirubrobacteraceae bacterium]|nr:hypothetical protein [Solirubrobacteraceae bacterium]
MSTAEASATAITTTWPAGFPADAKGINGFAVREVDAPAEAVYQWLLRPDLQTEFYGALRGVRGKGDAWPALSAGATISFFIGPLFIPPMKVLRADPQLLSVAWGSKAPGFQACHCFTVQAIDSKRSVLRSDETWVGPVARAIGPLTKGVLQKVQTDWCTAVARAATTHPSGPPA